MPRTACATPIPSIDSVLPLHVKWAHRRVPLSRGRHITGRIAPRPGHPVLVYESLLERNAMRALAARRECLELWTQPFTICFLYQGEERRYTPDILALFKPVPHDLLCRGFGKHTVIEVKPDKKAEKWRESMRVHRALLQLALSVPLVMMGENGIAQIGSGNVA